MRVAAIRQKRAETIRRRKASVRHAMVVILFGKGRA